MDDDGSPRDAYERSGRGRLGVVTRVVEAALVPQDVGRVLEAAAVAVHDGLACRSVTVRAFDEPGSSSMRRWSAAVPPELEVPVDDLLLDISGRAARVCWERRTASLLDVGDPDIEPLTTAQERDLMLAFMRSVRARQMLMAPMGAGAECLGWITLTRAGRDAPFDEDDVAAVVAVGRELGHVLGHARAFERQRELVARLREISEHQSRFTATLAHQLRNPLASINIRVEELAATLVGDDPDDPLAAGLAAIDRAARRINAITDSLLALARIEEPHAGRSTGRVDLRRVLRESVADGAERAGAAGITVDVTEVADLADVVGDATELEMVVDNLLGNAVKYGSPGGTVRLGLQQEGDWVRLTCADDGVGMTPDDVAHVFTAFHRSEAARAAGVPGSGLGMAIVQAAVERHDGRVAVESVLGAGTTVTVWLPAASV